VLAGIQTGSVIVRSGMATNRIDVEAVFRVHPFAQTILQRLRAGGHEAFLIGGVVRDGLQSSMGRDVRFPPDDVDIATSALPEDVRALFPKRTIVSVGEEFGVLVVVGPGGRSYEVASFRVEGGYDGRWPRRVELVRELEGDVKRRDLTINGLAAAESGQVIDFVGGVADLVARRVRAIGDPRARFREDYLRLLRAVRFICQIDGSMDGETASAIMENSSRIRSISMERIRDELLRLLGTSRAARGLALMDDLGLLEHVLPELLSGKGVPQPEVYHPEGDVFVHTLEAVRKADRFVEDPLVKLAVALHDIGKPAAFRRNNGTNMGGHCAIGARMCREIGERLRLSRDEIGRLSFLVKNHMRIAALPEMGRGKQVRFLSAGEHPDGGQLRPRYPLFFDLLEVLVADCEASAHRSSGWSPVLQETLQVAEHIDRVCGMKKAREIIDGNVLVELGLSPGPGLGRVLTELHDRILAGEITSREEAIDAARASIGTRPEGNNGDA
jgi:putative nucleotidyltransferase with HDIG domain